MKNVFIFCLITVFSTNSLAQESQGCARILFQNGDSLKVTILNLNIAKVSFQLCRDSSKTFLLPLKSIQSICDTSGRLLATGGKKRKIYPYKPPKVSKYTFEHIDTSQFWGIRMRGKNEFIVKIVGIGQDQDSIQVRTALSDTIAIAKREIIKLRAATAGKVVNGRVWEDHRYVSSLLINNNAYNLKKGQKYYQNFGISYNKLGFGITNNVSIEAGTILLPSLNSNFGIDGLFSPVWIAPKLSIPIEEENLNISLNVLLGTVAKIKFQRETINTAISPNFGIAYGNVTLGSRDRNITAGIGYGANNFFEKYTLAPSIAISAMYRCGPQSYLITENYLLGFDEQKSGLITVGGRWTGTRVAFDYGVAFLVKDNYFPRRPFPWSSMVISLGKP